MGQFVVGTPGTARCQDRNRTKGYLGSHVRAKQLVMPLKLCQTENQILLLFLKNDINSVTTVELLTANARDFRFCTRVGIDMERNYVTVTLRNSSIAVIKFWPYRG